MLPFIISTLLSTLPGANKYGVALISQVTGNVKASAVLIHPHAALTAAHATDDVGTLVTLKCPGTITHGIVTRRSMLLDLALVEFEEECDAPVADLADRNPGIGDPITIVGFPGGAFLTVTAGTVSAFEVIQAATVPRYALISDAQIFPGSSGGPVFNDDGLLIGIVTGRICFDDKEQPGTCFSSSVPISLIRLFMQATK